MKQITALVEKTTLQDIQNAMPFAWSDWLITVSNVHHHANRDVVTHVYRGVRFSTRFAERIRLDVHVHDHAVADVIEWITVATGASLMAPARVSVTSIETVLDIRAGQSTPTLSAAA